MNSFILNNIIIAFFAYMIDKIYGEFSFRHPVLYIGDVIKFFEKLLYRDSIFWGVVFVFCVVGFIAGISLGISEFLLNINIYFSIIMQSCIASMFIAHNMLRSEVRKVLEAKTLNQKRKQISMLVSRDTKELNENEIYKASIETYAENLSDGVIAPIFYLVLFGLNGIIIYKTINTLDSMVGYRNKKYQKFGKFAARLDDIVNFIPARITALLIMIVSKTTPLFGFYKYAKLHKSPNAGYPISAMALSLGIKLGGATLYFGKMEQKPFFGKGRKEIYKEDVMKALELI